MARLIWSAAGERFYEVGVDRGVLYLPLADGVPWTGLISVTESPNGGDPKPFYYDGIKYSNLATSEEFDATIEAFSSPTEFLSCDGMAAVQNGLFATQQPRRPFSLSYRTLVGNDTEGTDLGYKIHIVYNALASPTNRANKTNSDRDTPITLSWTISTLPPPVTDIRRTAHFVIDSRYTDPGLLSDVEDILYGSVVATASLPTAQALYDMFSV
jgi:hypothetical protein